jgi:hypothetical protein
MAAASRRRRRVRTKYALYSYAGGPSGLEFPRELRDNDALDGPGCDEAAVTRPADRYGGHLSDAAMDAHRRWTVEAAVITLVSSLRERCRRA